MKYIAHRINTIAELQYVNNDFGVELDLRDDLDGKIYIQHDPFVKGELFENYLRQYDKGLMILNIKSERIEYEVLKLVGQYGVQEFFFLDSSFPMIYMLSKGGCRNIALRFSEYEGMDTIRKMAGLVDWVWVDCFTSIPLDNNSYNEMKKMGYKLCFVSPELQGRDSDIEKYIEYLNSKKICFDAICTKYYNIDRWKSSYMF